MAVFGESFTVMGFFTAFDIAGADIEARDGNGQTPLSNAADSGRLGVVEFLICTAGADANTRDTWDRTPISLAAASGWLDIVVFLASHGADVETLDCDGQTPVIAASRSRDSYLEAGYPEIVAFLKEIIEKRHRFAADVGNLTKSATRR